MEGFNLHRVQEKEHSHAEFIPAFCRGPSPEAVRGAWERRIRLGMREPELRAPQTDFCRRLICPAGRDEFALPYWMSAGQFSQTTEPR
jgi:hypothetical protein